MLDYWQTLGVLDTQQHEWFLILGRLAPIFQFPARRIDWSDQMGLDRCLL